MGDDTDILDSFKELMNELLRREDVRRDAMRHTGVVLENKSSGVRWEVIGSEKLIIPGHLTGWGEDKVVYRSRVKSLNSGQIRSFIPKHRSGKYRIVSIPDAVKILYGMKED